MNVDAFGVALLIFLGVLILMKYNIHKQVSQALFITGLLEWFISHNLTFMTLAIMIVMCTAIININRVIK